MTTNLQPKRPVGEQPVVEPTTTPGVTSTGVGGVAVYDQYEDERANATRSSATSGQERVPVETRSSGSVITWIIAAIVLIVLAYFLFQFIF